MAALKSLQPAAGALLRNPVLIVLVGLYGLIQLPQLLLQPSQPILAAVVSLGASGVLLLAIPFIQGGLLGMADEALTGQTNLGTFIAEGKRNYVILLLGYFTIFAINLVLGVAMVFAVIIGGVGFAVGNGQPNLAVLAVVVVVGLLAPFAYLLFAFFIQFYAHAVVLSGSELVAGFKQSVALVRQNLLSTFGYSLILLVGGIVLGGISGLASFAFAPQPADFPFSFPEVSTVLVAVAAVVYILAIAMLGGFYATYSVSFYRSIEV